MSSAARWEKTQQLDDPVQGENPFRDQLDPLHIGHGRDLRIHVAQRHVQGPSKDSGDDGGAGTSAYDPFRIILPAHEFVNHFFVVVLVLGRTGHEMYRFRVNDTHTGHGGVVSGAVHIELVTGLADGGSQTRRGDGFSVLAQGVGGDVLPQPAKI